MTDDAVRFLDDVMSGRSTLPVKENMSLDEFVQAGQTGGYHFNEVEITDALLRRMDVAKTMA